MYDGLEFFSILNSSLVLSSVQLGAVYDGSEGLRRLPPTPEQSLGLGDLFWKENGLVNN